jgi:hypothetical protein
MDAVNRNKVSIRQLPLYFHSLHVQLDIFKDYFYYNGSVVVHNLTYRCYVSHVGTKTRGPQYMLSNLVQI